MKFLVCYLLTIVLLLTLIFTSSCSQNVKRSSTKYVIDGSKVDEIEIEGCQYLNYAHTITHKGNCKNPIHY